MESRVRTYLRDKSPLPYRFIVDDISTTVNAPTSLESSQLEL